MGNKDICDILMRYKDILMGKTRVNWKMTCLQGQGYIQGKKLKETGVSTSSPNWRQICNEYWWLNIMKY